MNEIALKAIIAIIIITIGMLFGLLIRQCQYTNENCILIIDGKTFKSSTLPKINSEKRIKFITENLKASIPFEKEIIIKVINHEK